MPEYVSEKQQVGFLTLLGDLLKHLGSRVVPRWSALLERVLDLIAGAQAALNAHMVGAVDISAEEEPAEGEEEGHEEPTGSLRTLRSIRPLGLKRLADFSAARSFTTSRHICRKRSAWSSSLGFRCWTLRTLRHRGVT